MRSTILIVDDELIVRRTLADALGRSGYLVETAASGTEALARLAKPGIDLLLLDLQLGDLDGTVVLQYARSQWSLLPIIMLTAHGSLPSAIEAVRNGASDYLLKPVSIEDLRQRINDVLMRYQSNQTRFDNLRTMYEQMRSFLTREGVLEVGGEAPAGEALESGPLCLNIRQHLVTLEGQAVPVTPSEFAILAELLRQPGAVVSCGDLVRATNTTASDEEEARQLIRPHIVRLRRKLEADPQQPRYLISVRGVGYRWVGDGTGVER